MGRQKQGGQCPTSLAAEHGRTQLTWNLFQTAHKKQGLSMSDMSQLWKLYKAGAYVVREELLPSSAPSSSSTHASVKQLSTADWPQVQPETVENLGKICCSHGTGTAAVAARPNVHIQVKLEDEDDPTGFLQTSTEAPESAPSRRSRGRRRRRSSTHKPQLPPSTTVTTRIATPLSDVIAAFQPLHPASTTAAQMPIRPISVFELAVPIPTLAAAKTGNLPQAKDVGIMLPLVGGKADDELGYDQEKDSAKSGSSADAANTVQEAVTARTQAKARPRRRQRQQRRSHPIAVADCISDAVALGTYDNDLQDVVAAKQSAPADSLGDTEAPDECDVIVVDLSPKAAEFHHEMTADMFTEKIRHDSAASTFDPAAASSAEIASDTYLSEMSVGVFLRKDTLRERHRRWTHSVTEAAVHNYSAAREAVGVDVLDCMDYRSGGVEQAWMTSSTQEEDEQEDRHNYTDSAAAASSMGLPQQLPNFSALEVAAAYTVTESGGSAIHSDKRTVVVPSEAVASAITAPAVTVKPVAELDEAGPLALRGQNPVSRTVVASAAPEAGTTAPSRPGYCGLPGSFTLASLVAAARVVLYPNLDAPVASNAFMATAAAAFECGKALETVVTARKDEETAQAAKGVGDENQKREEDEWTSPTVSRGSSPCQYDKAVSGGNTISSALTAGRSGDLTPGSYHAVNPNAGGTPSSFESPWSHSKDTKHGGVANNSKATAMLTKGTAGDPRLEGDTAFVTAAASTAAEDEWPPSSLSLDNGYDSSGERSRRNRFFAAPVLQPSVLVVPTAVTSSTLHQRTSLTMQPTVATSSLSPAWTAATAVAITTPFADSHECRRATKREGAPPHTDSEHLRTHANPRATCVMVAASGTFTIRQFDAAEDAVADEKLEGEEEEWCSPITSCGGTSPASISALDTDISTTVEAAPTGVTLAAVSSRCTSPSHPSPSYITAAGGVSNAADDDGADTTAHGLSAATAKVSCCHYGHTASKDNSHIIATDTGSDATPAERTVNCCEDVLMVGSVKRNKSSGAAAAVPRGSIAAVNGTIEVRSLEVRTLPPLKEQQQVLDGTAEDEAKAASKEGLGHCRRSERLRQREQQREVKWRRRRQLVQSQPAPSLAEHVAVYQEKPSWLAKHVEASASHQSSGALHGVPRPVIDLCDSDGDGHDCGSAGGGAFNIEPDGGDGREMHAGPGGSGGGDGRLQPPAEAADDGTGRSRLPSVVFIVDISSDEPTTPAAGVAAAEPPPTAVCQGLDRQACGSSAFDNDDDVEIVSSRPFARAGVAARERRRGGKGSDTAAASHSRTILEIQQLHQQSGLDEQKQQLYVNHGQQHQIQRNNFAAGLSTAGNSEGDFPWRQVVDEPAAAAEWTQDRSWGEDVAAAADKVALAAVTVVTAAMVVVESNGTMPVSAACSVAAVDNLRPSDSQSFRNPYGLRMQQRGEVVKGWCNGNSGGRQITLDAYITQSSSLSQQPPQLRSESSSAIVSSATALATEATVAVRPTGSEGARSARGGVRGPTRRSARLALTSVPPQPPLYSGDSKRSSSFPARVLEVEAATERDEASKPLSPATPIVCKDVQAPSTFTSSAPPASVADADASIAASSAVRVATLQGREAASTAATTPEVRVARVAPPLSTTTAEMTPPAAPSLSKPMKTLSEPSYGSMSRTTRSMAMTTGMADLAVADSRLLRERDLRDDDPLLAGFSRWVQVRPDKAAIAAARPPAKPGIYEWGARAPGADAGAIAALYLGKAGGGRSRETLSSRFRKYVSTTRLLLGPMESLAATERAVRPPTRRELQAAARKAAKERARTNATSPEGPLSMRVRAAGEARKAMLWRRLQSRGFELFYRYRVCEGEEDAAEAERAILLVVNYAGCMVNNGSYRELLLLEPPSTPAPTAPARASRGAEGAGRSAASGRTASYTLADYPVLRPELECIQSLHQPASGVAAGTRGQQQLQAAEAAARRQFLAEMAASAEAQTAATRAVEAAARWTTARGMWTAKSVVDAATGGGGEGAWVEEMKEVRGRKRRGKQHPRDGGGGRRGGDD